MSLHVLRSRHIANGNYGAIQSDSGTRHSRRRTGPRDNLKQITAPMSRRVYGTPMGGDASVRKAPCCMAVEEAGKLPHARESARSLAVATFCIRVGFLSGALLGGRRYIDPGTGSFAIQITMASVLGGLLTARLWLRHVFWRVVGRGRRSKNVEQASVQETDR